MDLEQRKRNKEGQRLENLVEASKELKQRLAYKEDVWIKNEHGVFIPNIFKYS